MITLEYTNSVSFTTHGMLLEKGDSITLEAKEASTLTDTFPTWFKVISKPETSKEESKVTEETKKSSKK